MKHRWKIFLGFLVLVTIGVTGYILRPNPHTKAALKAWQSLRDSGFKTDLSEFDFTLSDHDLARFQVFTNAAFTLRELERSSALTLMRQVGSNSALPIWREPSLLEVRSSAGWDEVRLQSARADNALNQAATVLLDGPVRSCPIRRGAFLLPYLTDFRTVAQHLGEQTMLDLHDGNYSRAWEHLLALTRFATDWQPRPFVVAHVVRFAVVDIAYETTWEAMQTNAWTDEQLALLQDLWADAQFWKSLPETTALDRVDKVEMLRAQRTGLSKAIRKSVLPMLLKSPRMAWAGLKFAAQEYWSQREYMRVGTYEDEAALMLYYRDREIELQNAITNSNWAEMRVLSGVTNQTFLHNLHSPRIQAQMNLQMLNHAFAVGRRSLLGKASEAEIKRRILISAIALKRYQLQHAVYPDQLNELTPDYLDTVPLDFMNGQPLHYQPVEGAGFVLYSVGLDCIDQAGYQSRPLQFIRGFPSENSLDIVWPLPASEPELEKYRAEVIAVRNWVQGRSENQPPQEILEKIWHGRSASDGPTARII